MAKTICYGEEARKALQAGIDKLLIRLRSLWVPRDATLCLIRNSARPLSQTTA